MNIIEMIEEWERGCSCTTGGSPEQCPECTKALIEAIRRKDDTAQSQIVITRTPI